MTLATAKIVALDSATLGNVSRDYWNRQESYRNKARSFLTRLQNLGVFVTVTLTHIIELARHGSHQVVRDRLDFLRSIPLIAWLRPYDRNWFAGAIPDLLCRELHAVVHGSARNWPDIVAQVRADLWETGVGTDVFVESDEFWSLVKGCAHRQHEVDKHVASVIRTDPESIIDVKLADALRWPIRPKEERRAYLQRFAREMERQLKRHGDKRLARPDEIARKFASDTLKDVEAIEQKGGDTIHRLLESVNVPADCVSPDMTVGELGELAVYASQLDRLAAKLQPAVQLTIKDVPPTALPSYVLAKKLASMQSRAERVSGSDLGDATMAPLVLYADGVQVDKRTNEFLIQIRRDEPKLAPLMGRFYRSSEYSQMPQLFDD